MKVRNKGQRRVAAPQFSLPGQRRAKGEGQSRIELDEENVFPFSVARKVQQGVDIILTLEGKLRRHWIDPDGKLDRPYSDGLSTGTTW